MKISKIIFSIIFFIIIFVFFALNIFIPDKNISYVENRPLEQMPTLNIETISDGSFMEKFEIYTNDQMLLRDTFVNISSNIKRILGQKEINNVILGKDNYLIEKFTKNDLDEERTKTNIDFINTFTKKYDNVYVGLIPTATEILTNKHSWYPNKVSQEEMINNIYQQLENTNTIDITKTLKQHSNEEIFYKTDHHWTTLGSYYGYLEICKTLNIKPLQLSDFNKEIIVDDFLGTIQSKVNIKTEKDILYKYILKEKTEYEIINADFPEDIKTDLYFYEKLESKEKYAVYLGGNNGLVYIKNNNISKKKLLLVKDSYSHSLVPFLINHYSEIIMVDMRHYMGKVETLIEENNPKDILILYNLKNFISDRYFVKLNLSK